MGLNLNYMNSGSCAYHCEPYNNFEENITQTQYQLKQQHHTEYKMHVLFKLLKGAVSRDFCHFFYFINRSYLGP